MATQQIYGTVTRKSNGSIEFVPTDAAAFTKLPAMGDEVTLDITVTRTVAEVEQAAAAAKAERRATASAPAVAPPGEPVTAKKPK
jgi:hypothetical protein